MNLKFLHNKCLSRKGESNGKDIAVPGQSRIRIFSYVDTI